MATAPRATSPPGAPSELVFELAEPDFILARLRNMTFCCWQAQPTVPQVEAFIAMAAAITRTYSSCSNLSLILPGTELPGREATAALETLTSEYARHIHTVALVVDGGGFWASIIRSFLTGLHLLRGNGYRSKSFPSTEAAAAWMLPAHNADTGCEVTGEEMAAACAAIRARLRPRS